MKQLKNQDEQQVKQPMQKPERTVLDRAECEAGEHRVFEVVTLQIETREPYEHSEREHHTVDRAVWEGLHTGRCGTYLSNSELFSKFAFLAGVRRTKEWHSKVTNGLH